MDEENNVNIEEIVKQVLSGMTALRLLRQDCSEKSK